MPGRHVSFVSFRLGGDDGVAIEAAKWAGAFATLGWEVQTVAGAGPVDVEVPGLAIGASAPPDPRAVQASLAGADLVVVENLCSLPLNPPAAAVVAEVLAGRPAVLHHHDLPWQRPQFTGFPPPPDDRAWRHVTINDLSRRELADRGVEATVVRNTFDPDPPAGERGGTRRALGVADDEVLVLQPTRAIPRKNVAGGLALTEALGGVFWLLGPAEDGYGPELDALLASASVPVRHGPGPGGAGAAMADAYAACDVVALPSTWEGFGNPSIESATNERPLAIGRYPVADELVAFGFRWFAADTPAPLEDWLTRPDASLIAHNHDVARRHFSVHDLPSRIESVLSSLGL